MSIDPVHTQIKRSGGRLVCMCVPVATNVGITGKSTQCGVEFTAALVKRVAEYRGSQRFADSQTFANVNGTIAQLNEMTSGAGWLHRKAA